MKRHTEDTDFNIQFPAEIEQYERKIYDLRQLIEISKGLNSTLEYNILIDSILLTCMGQMQLLMAGIFLKKGIGHENYALHRNYKGFEVDHSIEYELEPESPVIKFIEQNFKCYTLDELGAVVPSDRSHIILKMLNPSLVVPLISKGILNGIIILGERINIKNFTESEKEYLMDIASLAGIAIHNASLYEMATTDMMTKLKIHHYFHTLLIEEIDRARRLSRPLSIIMADIDHFKIVNDTHGHQAGDMILINVARIIKESIRQIDVASRYGGEEFAIILPGTEIHEALIVAERIRQNIEKSTLQYDNMELQATISIGVSQYDSEQDKTKNTLIERADKALYISKRNGRNIVSFL
jgi:two-component system, cell cycle response regulator